MNFDCDSDEVINIIKNLGKFGGKNINQQEISVRINNFNPQNINYIKQITSNFGFYSEYSCDCICFFISKNDEYALGYADGSKKINNIL